MRRIKGLAMMPKNAVRRLLVRLDRAAGKMNDFLLVLVIGLGCFYLSVAVVLNMPPRHAGPEDGPKYQAPAAPAADAASAYLPGPE